MRDLADDLLFESTTYRVVGANTGEQMQERPLGAHALLDWLMTGVPVDRRALGPRSGFLDGAEKRDQFHFHKVRNKFTSLLSI